MPATTDSVGEPGWKAKASGGMEALHAAMRLGTLGAYPGTWHGKDVIVLAVLAPQEGSTDLMTGNPLAIFCTDTVLEDLVVDHATTVTDG